MKTEILVAIGVLASGFAIAQLVFKSEPAASEALNSTQLASPLANVSIQPVQTDPRVASTSNHNSEEISEDPPIHFDASNNSFIDQAAYTLFNSPPLHAKLRYKIEMFGENISGPGRYTKKGRAPG